MIKAIVVRPKGKYIRFTFDDEHEVTAFRKICDLLGMDIDPWNKEDGWNDTRGPWENKTSVYIKYESEEECD